MSDNPDFSFSDRQELLADVAELYYLDGLTQNQVAARLGVDRSTVSRMLSEARRLKIVEVRISRPAFTDPNLRSRLIDRFGLQDALVITDRVEDTPQLIRRLGAAAAQPIYTCLQECAIVGISWGTAVGAVVDAIQSEQRISLKVVQLVGALGAGTTAYDGPGLVQRLSQKLGSEGYFLNAPFLVENAEIARSLQNTSSVQQVLALGRQSDLAILGVGTTETNFSSFYQAGYVPLRDLQELQRLGMVGDVCGVHFTLDGATPDIELNQRMITIRPDDLRKISLRMAIAGGAHKVKPILGAIRAGFVNTLITNAATANELLAVAG